MYLSASETTAVSTITEAAGPLASQLPAVAAVGLGVGVTLFVLRKGWSLVRSFVR